MRPEAAHATLKSHESARAPRQADRSESHGTHESSYRAARGDMPETLMELGTVAPNATVTVLPQLSGYLTEVGYREGQDAVKGQFLAQIDPRAVAGPMTSCTIR